MKQYFYEGKAIELGKPFHFSNITKTESNIYKTENLTEDMADHLVSKGILTVKEVASQTPEKIAKVSLGDCVRYYASRMEVSEKVAMDMICSIVILSHKAGTELIAKAASAIMNKGKGSLSESKELWIISMPYHTITKLNHREDVDYKYIATFRTKEEAMIAYSLMMELVNLVFSNGRK